jgi:hypothetical protein
VSNVTIFVFGAIVTALCIVFLWMSLYGMRHLVPEDRPLEPPEKGR